MKKIEGKKSPREAAATLMNMNKLLRSRLEQATAESAALKAENAQIRHDLSRIQDDLDRAVLRNEKLLEQVFVANMHIAGLDSQVDAYEAEISPGSPLKKEVGGVPRIQKLYQESFDRKGRELGIHAPESYRTG